MSQTYGQKLREARGRAATAQTDTTLQAAPNGGRSLAIAYIFVMADTAMTVTLKSGASTIKFELFPAARGGATASAPIGDYLFECSPSEALTYSTSTGGNHYVHILYGEI